MGAGVEQIQLPLVSNRGGYIELSYNGSQQQPLSMLGAGLKYTNIQKSNIFECWALKANLE